MEDQQGTPSLLRQSGSQSRSPNDLTLVVQTIIEHFYVVDPSPEARAMEIASWLKVLSGSEVSEVQAAWESYQFRHRKEARLPKPTAAHLRYLIGVAKPRPIEQHKPPEQRTLPDLDARLDMLVDTGLWRKDKAARFRRNVLAADDPLPPKA